MRENPIFEEPNNPVKNNNQCDSDTSRVSPQWFGCELGWKALWWCSSAEQVSPQSNADFSIDVWCWVCCIGTMQNPYVCHHLNISIKLYAYPCSTDKVVVLYINCWLSKKGDTLSPCEQAKQTAGQVSHLLPPRRVSCETCCIVSLLIIKGIVQPKKSLSSEYLLLE